MKEKRQSVTRRFKTKHFKLVLFHSNLIHEILHFSSKLQLDAYASGLRAILFTIFTALSEHFVNPVISLTFNLEGLNSDSRWYTLVKSFKAFDVWADKCNYGG